MSGRRAAAAALLLALLITLASCDKSPTPPPGGDIEPFAEGFTYSHSDDSPLARNAVRVDLPQISGEYLYYIGGTTLLRCNLKTGNLTSVCSDPLCDHKSEDCPFYGITMGVGIFRPLGGKIAFIKRYTDGAVSVNRLCRYDISEKKLSVIEEIGGNGHDLTELYVGGLRYYYGHVCDEATGEWNFRLCRMDISSDRPADTLLAAAEGLIPPGARLAFSLDGRIWLSDGAVIYSVSPDLADIREEARGEFGTLMFTDGEYIYYSRPLDNAALGTALWLCSVHRMRPDGTGDTDLCTVTPLDWLLTEKYIYYLEYDKVAVGKNGIRGYAGKEVVLECGRLRRMNHDGSGDEAVYTFSGEEANTRFLGWTVYGNYAYGRYASYTDENGDGTITEDEVYGASFTAGDPINLIRIDLTTGEAWYIYDY